MDFENKLINIMSLLFEKDVDADLTMQNEDLWDSLKHIEIIMTVEEEFGISFNPEDIPKLTSLKLILEKIIKLKESN